MTDDTVIEKFGPSRLEPMAVSPFSSCNLHSMIASKSYTNVYQTTLWIKSGALKRNVIHVVKEMRGENVFESPEGLADTVVVQDCGKPLFGNSVAIVNPETGCVCGPQECGEIWVTSSWTGHGYSESFALANVDSKTRYYRTGERGFLWPVPKENQAEESSCGWGGLVDAEKPHRLVLFVLGPFETELVMKGLRHSLHDLESTAQNASSLVSPEGCIIFPHAGSIVCTVEIEDDSKILNVGCRIATSLLKHHRLALDVISFLRPGMLAKSRLGEKQRGKVAMAYHLGKLPVIHVMHLHPR